MAKILTAVAKLEAGMRFDAQATSGYHVTLDSKRSERRPGQRF